MIHDNQNKQYLYFDFIKIKNAKLEIDSSFNKDLFQFEVNLRLYLFSVNTILDIIEKFDIGLCIKVIKVIKGLNSLFKDCEKCEHFMENVIYGMNPYEVNVIRNHECRAVKKPEFFWFPYDFFDNDLLIGYPNIMIALDHIDDT